VTNSDKCVAKREGTLSFKETKLDQFAVHTSIIPVSRIFQVFQSSVAASVAASATAAAAD
jgi:hypothetical protein